MRRQFYKIAFLICCALAAVSIASAQTARKQTKTAAPPNSDARKIDGRLAESPVYPSNSKSCKNKDKYASEGDEFVRECAGFGNYVLRINGSDYRKNYGVFSTDAEQSFSVMFFPLESGDAKNYERGDLYDEKLGEKIFWILDDRGKPFAVFVRASFYKNTGSAKTFSNPKNKRAEFVLLRGLKGYETINTDIPTKDTAFNPDEQAKKIAFELLEKNKK